MKSRNLITAALLIASFTAHASDAFDTTDEAASAALHTVQDVSRETNSEFGGLLYSFEGKVFYTDVVTDKSPGTVTLRGKMPKGAKLVGIFHTHPGMSDIAEQFSQSDLDVARTLKVPSYIIATKSGHIHCFTAGIDHPTLSHMQEVSFGHTV